MKIGGSSIWAVLVAAVAMYAVGALIYAVLFDELWMSLQGLTKESAETAFAGEEWRMALSPIMPVMIAVGVALVMGWRGARGLAGGASTGFLLGLLFMLSARLYGFAYSTEAAGLVAIDAVHFLGGATVVGAILGAWPAAKKAA
jgi:Protein of unknown function (DUF1761)